MVTLSPYQIMVEEIQMSAHSFDMQAVRIETHSAEDFVWPGNKDCDSFAITYAPTDVVNKHLLSIY